MFIEEEASFAYAYSSVSNGFVIVVTSTALPRAVSISLCLSALLLGGARLFAQQGGGASPPTLAITRHALQNNGRIEGSCQQLTGEGVNFNGGAVLLGDFLVPGTPTV